MDAVPLDLCGFWLVVMLCYKSPNGLGQIPALGVRGVGFVGPSRAPSNRLGVEIHPSLDIPVNDLV